MDTLELTFFDVESKSSQIWSKLRRNLRAHKFRLEMCGASQYKPNRPKSTARVFDRGCVFVKACSMYVDRAHTHAAVEAVSAVAAAEQPGGWRSRHGHPRYTVARSAGRPWVARTQFSTADHSVRNTPNIFLPFFFFLFSFSFLVW